ncbi:MAG TPA: SGNH/GDSL hydrolase family protein, partial [Solirubrobacterales bacterium]|nr:SGNH/GDSL hydrolase family protein [Solirubrobacterales bacterium]
MRALLVHLLLLLAVAAGAAPAAAATPPFDWSVPERLGGDENEDGLLDYVGSAIEFEEEEAAREGFTVELEVRRDLCRKDISYTWRSAAGVTGGRGKAGCSVSQVFSEEGEYPVRLELLFPGGKRVQFDREVAVEDWLIVSIGDSVASGEGNPDIPGSFGRAKWKFPRCHRSAKAGPALAALGLEAADSQTSTTFVHLACSGAEIYSGLLQGYEGIDPGWRPKPRLLPSQVKELEQVAASRQVDAVLLSVGANDVHFGPIVSFCLFHRECHEKEFSPKEKPRPPKRPLSEVVTEALARLPDGYAELADRLKAAKIVPPDRVLIVDYFDSTKDERGETCEKIVARNRFGFFQIDKEEAEWAANHVLGPLNEAVGDAAAAAGWTEVRGVAEAFATHGYCAREPWIRRLGESFSEQKGKGFLSRFKGTLHPNEQGHLQTGEMIGLALAGALYGGPLAEAGPDRVTVTVEKKGGGAEDGEDEESLEEGVLTGLGGIAAAVGVVAFWLLRRRPESWTEDGSDGDPPVPSAPSEWPPEKSVAAFAALVEDPAGWVHRRVESIEIVDERLVRRRVSVDFTPEPPQGSPRPTHAPIALLSKRVLSRFDLRDETGASVPLATSEQNAAFAASHMLRVAAEATGAPPSPLLRLLCWRIARGNPAQAGEAIHEIATRLEPIEDREALRKSQRFRGVTETFAANFAVLAEVDDPKRRRVIKLAYDHAVGGGSLTWRQRLGLDPVLTAIEIPELGDAASRHIEFARSEGLDILGVQLLAVQPDGETVVQEGSAGGAEAHLAMVRRPLGTRGLAGVFLRAARSGILVGGPPLAMLSALALTIAWFALPELAGASASGAASLLLAVPAAFGAYLGSRASHPLEARMLLG